MKILLISNMFPPFIMGGAEMAAHSLAHWLVANGHQVHVLTSAHTPDIEGVEESGGGLTIERRFFPSVYQIYKANARNPLIKYIWHAHDHFHLHSEQIVSEVIARVRPEIVNTHNLQGIGYNVLRAVGKSMIPCVQTIHDFGLICVNMNMFREGEECDRHHLPCQLSTFVKRSYFQTIQNLSFWSPSEALLQRYQPHLAPCMYAEAIPLPLAFAPVEHPSLEEKKTELRLLYAGQVVPWKGIAFLLDVLRKLPADISWRIDVAGGGRDLDDLRSRHGDCGNIHFHGKLPPERVGDLMVQADLLMVPSLWFENAPLVISQATQIGLPVFASRIGGLSEMVVNDLNGRLLSPGDSDQWEKALQEAACERQHLQRWKVGAAEQAAKFSINILGEKVVALFRKTMASPHPETMTKNDLCHVAP